MTLWVIGGSALAVAGLVVTGVFALKAFSAARALAAQLRLTATRLADAAEPVQAALERPARSGRPEALRSGTGSSPGRR